MVMALMSATMLIATISKPSTVIDIVILALAATCCSRMS